MKFLIAIAFVLILGALGAAGLLMVKRPGPTDGADGSARAPDKRMARALAVRVGVSVALFLFILLSYQLGWIRPTGIRLGQ